MTKEEIQKKRFKLRISIKEDINKLKNKNDSEIENKIKEKVIEFNKLTDQLKTLGFNPTINAKHLTLEYWGLTQDKKDVKIPINKTPNKKIDNKNNNITTTQSKNIKSVYIITLAWSESKTNNCSIKPVENIKRYFESIKIKLYSDDFSDMGNRIEYMLNYRFYGTEDAFDIIKKSARFIIDSSIISDYDKFNIDIFGKKLK